MELDQLHFFTAPFLYEYDIKLLRDTFLKLLRKRNKVLRGCRQLFPFQITQINITHISRFKIDNRDIGIIKGQRRFFH